MTDETSTTDRDADAWGRPREESADASVDATHDLNEPVPPDAPERDGVDDELREAVADDLADLDDEPDYPSGDDPIEPQRVDVENAVFVALGVVALLALIAVLVLSV
ncbi:DUF7312 domain-containing protein [Halorubellus salinus]|uniref:DUF7312 domain-containing protein n=1 Tax=Halorubellus salinus TaxID=755309 RepID=UPI001D08A717|nr:hypothetical protein [Halorubellus salinus]